LVDEHNIHTGNVMLSAKSVVASGKEASTILVLKTRTWESVYPPIYQITHLHDRTHARTHEVNPIKQPAQTFWPTQYLYCSRYLCLDSGCFCI